jgi:hypothetical protein
MVTLPINQNGLNVDIFAISLEIKQVLGISFDPVVVEKSNINIFELRDAIVRTAKERRKELEEFDADKALLTHNDYMIANIPEILESSFCSKRIASISLGMENVQDALANIKFFDTKRKLLFESYRLGLKSTMGIPLTKEEFSELEERRKSLYGLMSSKSKNIGEFDIKEPKYKENNTSVIDKLKSIKQRLDKEDKKELLKIDKSIEKSEKKNKEVDIRTLYSRLNVRPMKFISALIDGKRVTRLAIVRVQPGKISNDVKKPSSK